MSFKIRSDLSDGENIMTNYPLPSKITYLEMIARRPRLGQGLTRSQRD